MGGAGKALYSKIAGMRESVAYDPNDEKTTKDYRLYRNSKGDIGGLERV